MKCVMYLNLISTLVLSHNTVSVKEVIISSTASAPSSTIASIIITTSGELAACYYTVALLTVVFQIILLVLWCLHPEDLTLHLIYQLLVCIMSVIPVVCLLVIYRIAEIFVGENFCDFCELRIFAKMLSANLLFC